MNEGRTIAKKTGQQGTSFAEKSYREKSGLGLFSVLRRLIAAVSRQLSCPTDKAVLGDGCLDEFNPTYMTAWTARANRKQQITIKDTCRYCNGYNCQLFALRCPTF